MIRIWLNEDRYPQKLFVRFSSTIYKNIEEIYTYNQNNVESLRQWYEYLEGIQNYLSNPSIAFDYANRFIQYPNGARFIQDFDYNVGYTVKTNNATNQAYVYIFNINLKPEEFGLKIPNNENKQYNALRNKTIIRLTETDLHRVIKESVRQVLMEYRDSKVWGWDYLQKMYRNNGCTDYELAMLKKSYDQYAQEEISKGEIPNDSGFWLWHTQKSYKAQKNGIQSLYPNYWAFD